MSSASTVPNNVDEFPNEAINTDAYKRASPLDQLVVRAFDAAHIALATQAEVTEELGYPTPTDHTPANVQALACALIAGGHVTTDTWNIKN